MSDFTNISSKPGLTIWRIEQMKVMLTTAKEYGRFFEGDSYVVLFGEKRGAGAMSWWIHFWLGRKTSQDEAGVAAFKSFELDEKLGGAAVQFRELQGHESARFLAYFPGGVTYRSGGVASGFKHVDPKQGETRLLRLKGKHRIRMTEMPLTWASFNSGDVFILEHNFNIIIWTGKSSNRMERLQAIKAANSIRDDMRGGNMKITIVEEGGSVNEVLKEVLGEMKMIKDASSAPQDEEFERANKKLKMYRVSDSSGALVLTEVGSCPLKQSNLSSNDCYIIDQGAGGIFVWKGKKANKNEKSMAMKNAMSFIKTKKYPQHTPIMAVIEDAEPTQFRMLFPEWKLLNSQVGLGKTHSIGRTSKITAQTQFDANSLHKNPSVAAESRMVDDGTGRVDIWVVENFELLEVEEELHGQFFAGDCYLVLYTYEAMNKKHVLLYYWIGSDSTQDEQGTVALKAIEIDNTLGGVATQIRLTQGKESNHFLAIFQGKLIVHLGGKSSGFRNLDSKKTINLTRNHLYRVRGNSTINTKAVEVNCTASELNSNDSFILKTKKALYCWYGLACNGDEREMAKNIASKLSARDTTIVMEGKESPEFWAHLGGKTEYFSGRTAALATYEPRLFHCSNASGRFTAEEVCNFSQSDLCEDDVMILDSFYEIFVWIGLNANEDEKSKSKETAIQYLTTDPGGRDSSTTIYEVQQGYEPIIFTGLFPDWGRDRFKTNRQYVEMKAAINGEDTASLEAELKKISLENKPKDEAKFYSLDELVNVDGLPPEIDRSKRETYLSSQAFIEAFGMGREDFASKPKWKQIEMKKKLNLF